MNLMVITSQKPITDTHKKYINVHKYNTKESHQTTREENKRRKEKRTTKPPENNNKMAISTYLSILTLKVNGLQHQSEDIGWLIDKQGPYICCLQKTHFRPKDTHELKVKR